EDRFEDKYPFDLYFISAGTGLAIKYAERGDADMALVHAPSTEFSFLQDGYGVCRKIIAYNFFAIVGPESDPARIEGLDPLRALQRIVESGRSGDTVWLSRGDLSGTHVKEKGLWKSAGYDWEGLREEDWLVETGTGMGKTLLVAEEKSGYTLADLGTYSKYYGEGMIDLKALVSKGKDLLNVYSAIAVNPKVNPRANFDGAIILIKFLVSEEGQQIIREYGQEFPQPLFYPAVNLVKEVEEDPALAQWIQEYAYLNGSECPPEYRADHPELYG
ncbi:MAG: substrate-binding domain-containing protein, partial [Candidatus Bathyarchaeia archaeon]